MSRQFAGRFWKWVLPAGLAVGLFGSFAPAGADDEKEVEVKKVVIKDGDDVRKDEERKDGDIKEERQEEVRKEADRKEERKEEVRKDGDRKEVRKEEVRKDGEGDRIDELTRFVKQLAGQVNELREEVRSLRSGGIAGLGSPEEMRKRMEEMQKKFAAGAPEGVNPEKFRAEFEKRFRAEQEKFSRGREGAGADAEAQIRRQIEQLNAELKRISAAREKEGADKKREDKEEKKEGSDAEEREAKERAAKKEAQAREAKEREDKKSEDK